MRALWLALVLAGPASALASAAAQDVGAGRQLAARACGACHGVNGIAKVPDAANLAGQDAGYLSRQLAHFRDGTREHEQMSVIARTLSDVQVADVSAYYGAITIEVTKVPER